MAGQSESQLKRKKKRKNEMCLSDLLMGSKNTRCMGTRISYNAYKDISIKKNLSPFMSSITVRRFSIVGDLRFSAGV